MSRAKRIAQQWIDVAGAELTGLADELWGYAEPSLREWRSARATARLLRSYGFEIVWGTGGFPSAFTATLGSGGPVLGFNVEYDALPGLSQRAGVPFHDPLVHSGDPTYAPGYGYGHGCGHNVLAAGSVGGAIAAARAVRDLGLDATVKVFASAGEEQLVGKAYAVRAGAYDGLDAFLDWHPVSVTATGGDGTSALISATFTFLGSPGHASTPLGTKSGLDAALMFTSMAERLRDKNLRPAGRLAYSFSGGGAPNVTPDLTTVWVYVREENPHHARILFDKIVQCASAAAMASQTTLDHRIVTAIWHSLANRRGAELVHANLTELGPASFTDADHSFASALQSVIGVPQHGLAGNVLPLSDAEGPYLGGPSSDVSEVSRQAPTLSFVAPAWPLGVPVHSWAATASAGTNIGHQAALSAARYLAATALDLIERPDVLAGIRAEFDERSAAEPWTTLLPNDAVAPLYAPPPDFLAATGQDWNPLTRPPLISAEPLGDV